MDTLIKIKSGLYVTNLDLILHYLWVLDKHVFPYKQLRTNLAAILVLAGATLIQPGALIKHLCYRDIEFQVFRPILDSSRARIGIVVTLNKMKRTGSKLRRKGYGFHKEPTLLYDPVLYIQSLAFVNGLF